MGDLNNDLDGKKYNNQADYIEMLLKCRKLNVWLTVKIRGTRVPKNAIMPVGRPRPYSIIILNMRFIPRASLRQVLKSQQVHI